MQRPSGWNSHSRLEIGTLIFIGYLLAAAFIGYLILVAEPWAVAANTRILAVLYRSGVVRLTDADAGYVDGAPDHEYFLRSQDPVDWGMVALAAIVLVAAWLLRSIRFHVMAAATGIAGTLRHHLGLHLGGEELGRYLPYELGSAATLAGVDGDEHRSAVARLGYLQFGARVFEIAVFSVVSILLIGVWSWLGAMFWAAIVLVGAIYLTWGRVGPGLFGDRGARDAAVAFVRSPGRVGSAIVLSLVAFPLEEVAAYLIVQAFTSTHVVLGGATPALLLLALVAGKTAQLVRVTPGGVGQFEWGFAAALVVGGQGLAEAVTITLLFSIVRHLTGGLVLGLIALRGGSGASVGEALRWSGNGLGAAGTSLFAVPSLPAMIMRLVTVGYVILAIVLLNQLRLLLVDLWLLESLGFASVFWTNAITGAVLFVVAAVLAAAAVIGPALAVGARGGLRRAAVRIGIIVALLVGMTWAGKHADVLLLLNGMPFGEADPWFGHDIGFYVFALPTLNAITGWLFLIALLGMTAWLAWATLAHADAPSLRSRAGLAFDSLRAPGAMALVGLAGLFGSVRLWLTRYDVLVKDNYDSSIPTGAEALDVTGLLSTVNQAWVLSAVLLGLTASALWWLWEARRTGERPRRVQPALLFLPWIAIGIVFSAGVGVRDVVAVTPNEPVIQLPHLQDHIDATNRAWGMERTEVIDFVPNGLGDPLPDIDRLLAHPSIKNAQLWPGAISWLERLLDPQHVDRLLLRATDQHPDLVLGATLEKFRQQQKFRPYYDFLDVDVVRYEIDGEPTLVTSSVRELPLLEPHPWLAFWGQRFVLFTHGHGLVAAPLGQISPDGGPVYLSSDIPPVITASALDPGGQHAIYYGEGSGNVGFSNVRDVPELDFPTDQGREDIFLPPDVDAGVRMDSILKRLVFAWGTSDLFDAGSFFDITFSSLITDETRIHFLRQPLDRVGTVAPFLFLDSDPYPVAGPDGIVWMVNGLTTTDRYPNSAYAELGDKSVRRGPFPVEVEIVNYAADAVKVTVDAYTGKVAFYRISDEPIARAWAAIYPDLFTAEMPAHVRDQRQYPPQLFHVQYDDLWIYYHVTDPMAFFNQEDIFDDADEVLGPMLEPGRGITFSMEPYPTIIETGVDFPGEPGGTQFAMAQVFTPEGARNLRAIVAVYQEGDDYGRLAMLQVPKGSFTQSPEQAESSIDQDDDIAQQFGFWSTIGVEVVRGYITPVVIDGEVIYIEPVFIRSAQNPYPQLNRVVVVMRGTATMAPTLSEALEAAYERLQGQEMLAAEASEP
jgi:uncharacterized membrane protein (UPF0182 family)